MESLFTVPDLPLLEAETTVFPLEEYAVCFEEVIKRSRFITLLAHVDSRQKALRFVEVARAAFPDASHYCWAYVAGGPGDTADIGQSDDGEPHGTAGRPMLNQLLHGGVGEIAAVTVRYFGGIKLGTGGLSRAYQNGVKGALALVRPVVRKCFIRATVMFEYGCMNSVLRLVQRTQGRVADQQYGSTVTMSLDIPDEEAAVFSRGFANATDGRGILEMSRAGSTVVSA